MTSFDLWAALKTLLSTGFNAGDVDGMTEAPVYYRTNTEEITDDYILVLENEQGPTLENNNGSYADEKYFIDAILDNNIEAIYEPFDTLVNTYKELFTEYRRLITINNKADYDAFWTMEPNTMKADTPVRIRFTAERRSSDQS